MGALKNLLRVVVSWVNSSSFSSFDLFIFLHPFRDLGILFVCIHRWPQFRGVVRSFVAWMRFFQYSFFVFCSQNLMDTGTFKCALLVLPLYYFTMTNYFWAFIEGKVRLCCSIDNRRRSLKIRSFVAFRKARGGKIKKTVAINTTDTDDREKFKRQSK